MITTIAKKIDWEQQTHRLGKLFAKRAAHYDQEGKFVMDNYEQLKTHQYFSAMIPTKFGGGGLSHAEMCNIIRILGHYCGSTALAFSMHQHLVAATIWKYKHKGAGAPLLQKIVDHQLILISTGARDWLDSNGFIEKVKGGYLVSAKKSFASQSIIGDIAITSAPYEHPQAGKQVLHFPVPMTAKGVQVLDDWQVMGMRGTGSNSIIFEKVFIAEEAIALARPSGEFHPVWNVVLTVAMPLIMSAYLGIAEKAMKITIKLGKNYHRNKNHITYLIGKMNNTLLSAQTQWKAMHGLTNNMDFQPNEVITIDMLSYKTNIADACKQVLAEAMEAIGGQSFYKQYELERMFRDIQGGEFHPLPKWNQYKFTGDRLLKSTN